MTDTTLYHLKMADGSRNFAGLPEIASFEAMRRHLRNLDGAVETDVVSDFVTEMWLHFEYRSQAFSINNQIGDYWFFVDDPGCPELLLSNVVEHFAKIIRK